MKSREANPEPHKVPLAPQAIAILGELHSLTGAGLGGLCFPGVRKVTSPISEVSGLAAMHRLGYAPGDVTQHGFRSSFSRLTNQFGLWHEDAIERQLAHTEGWKQRKAYHRAEYWDERVNLMRWWADQCDAMRGRTI
jgi:integrase